MPTGLREGVPLLAVTRGGRVEWLHRGSLAVVDEDGRLLAAAGDPEPEAFLRFAARPCLLRPFPGWGGGRRRRLHALDGLLPVFSLERLAPDGP